MCEDKKTHYPPIEGRKEKGRIEKRGGDLSPPLLCKERVQISS